jgi:hypothetical protein
VSAKSVMGTAATGQRNRSWPEALKQEIVAAKFAPGSSVSMVARQYELNANQVLAQFNSRFLSCKPQLAEKTANCRPPYMGQSLSWSAGFLNPDPNRSWHPNIAYGMAFFLMSGMIRS